MSSVNRAANQLFEHVEKCKINNEVLTTGHGMRFQAFIEKILWGRNC